MVRRLFPQVRVFNECDPYEQNEPGTASFRWILKNNEIPDLCMGLVTMEGPIHKTPGTHEDWDQVYLVFCGSATIHLDDKAHRVTGPSAVIIPRGVLHSVELKPGEKIQYVYVNRWKTSQ